MIFKVIPMCIVPKLLEYYACLVIFMSQFFHAQRYHYEILIERIFPYSSVQSFRCVRLFVTPWLQHTRLPCPSPSPGACSNSCPSNQWCHITISSSVVSFFSCLQSFPASWLFSNESAFASGGQSIRVSASTSVLPMYTQNWSPDWLDILAVQGTLKGFLQHHCSKASILILPCVK